MYRIESKIVEKLKEQDLNATDLLQEHAKKRTKRKISREGLRLLEEYHVLMKKIIVEDYDDQNTQLAMNSLQAIEEFQKELERK
ncbi:hypothetical protein LCGC14_2552230 [marine sediment metagenome]|uniref:Uncharacterized protein n=1 Tax=marine sediment metagenome TaxID=412755 RepID=A0A0F9DFL4_9ZZZZ